MPWLLAAGGAIPPFFILLTVVLLAVVVVSLVLTRIKQSLLVGYFLCGILISNSGLLDWVGVEQVEVIDALAEIGVVLLLFTLGIEFSLKEIKALQRPVFVGGGSQVGLCILLGIVGGMCLGLNISQAVLLGFALSLSSTAVSMKSFQELGLPESPQARTALGMAIYQDLAAIVFMVLLPPLLSEDGGSGAVFTALIRGHYLRERSSFFRGTVFLKC
ncbi:cation:proton antiporter [Rubritalea tangerina]|uniref:cation:proton antiporter domain-containing protein n=1 Tax=Rubritalea tangerina TaxID=430798 RepID=UPI003617C6DB